jgi:hypothetical protein
LTGLPAYTFVLRCETTTRHIKRVISNRLTVSFSRARRIENSHTVSRVVGTPFHRATCVIVRFVFALYNCPKSKQASTFGFWFSNATVVHSASLSVRGHAFGVYFQAARIPQVQAHAQVLFCQVMHDLPSLQGSSVLPDGDPLTMPSMIFSRKTVRDVLPRSDGDYTTPPTFLTRGKFTPTKPVLIFVFVSSYQAKQITYSSIFWNRYV